MNDTNGCAGVGPRKCYFCGVSTLRGPRRRSRALIRSYQLTDEYLNTYPYIAEFSRHLFSDKRQISQEDRICRPCFQRAGRFRAQKEKHRLEQEEVEKVIQFAIKEEFRRSPSASESDPRLSPAEQLVDEEVDQDDGDDEAIPQKKDIPPQRIPASFPVPDFSRTTNSSSVCLIKSCRENKIRRIPVTKRREILQKQNLFITRGSRICDNHLHGEVLNDIAANCRSTVDTFNSEQVSEMMNLLQGKIVKK